MRQGPQYLKIGGRIVYRLEDIEAFEAAQVRSPTLAETQLRQQLGSDSE